MRPDASDFDFGRRSDDYGEHRPGFPTSFYDRVDAVAPIGGARALDVGTGPGVIALELARRGARVTGLDVAENQLRVARQRADELGLAKQCEFLCRPAEETGLGAGSFDLAFAGQCWHWFDEKPALREFARVIAPGGLLVVAHYCYLPHHSQIAKLTEELILEHNPGWKMAGLTGLFPQYVDSLIGPSFELVEQFCYDHDRVFTHQGWRGRIRTCNGVGSGVLSDAQVDAFDAALTQLLARECPEQFPVRHRIWATLVRRA